MNWWDDEARTILIAYAAVAGPALVVFVAFRPRPLLPMQRLRSGSWGGASVLFHYVLWTTAILPAYVVFDRLGLFERLLPHIEVLEDAAAGVADQLNQAKAAAQLKAIRLSNLCMPLGSALFLAMSFTLLPILQRSHVSSAGITGSRWWSNLRLGLIAFVIATPPIFAIQFVCTRAWGAEQHPFEILGKQHGLELVEWAAILIDVSLLGPICEEWIFRGLLQGWLRRATYLERAIFVCIAALFVGYLVTMRKAAGIAVPIGLVAWTAILVAVYLAGLYALYRPLHRFGLALFRRSDLPPLPEEENAIDAWTVNLFEAEGHEHLQRPWRDFGPNWFPWKLACARWSIVGSAMFFALAHGAWPTPIALFFLGLVLGWLAFRTQSLVAPIVVHGLFNLMSFLMLVMASRHG